MSATRASNRVRKPSKRQREELGVATEKVIITVEDTGDNGGDSAIGKVAQDMFNEAAALRSSSLSIPPNKRRKSPQQTPIQISSDRSSLSMLPSPLPGGELLYETSLPQIGSCG
jgi:hypothetical protein